MNKNQLVITLVLMFLWVVLPDPLIGWIDDALIFTLGVLPHIRKLRALTEKQN